MSKVTPQQIIESLPKAPKGYTYSVENVSPLVNKVWFHHHYPYDYACGKPVKTIYCFLKSDKVHPPKSKDKMRVKSLCHISELSQQDPLTTIIPSGPSNLWHLN